MRFRGICGIRDRAENGLGIRFLGCLGRPGGDGILGDLRGFERGFL